MVSQKFRSERKSSIESKELVFPEAISPSASSSAFSQLNSLCKKDRSIAIAHGLEDLCEVKAPEKKAKKRKSAEDKPAAGKRGKKKSAGDDAIAKMGLEY